MKHEPIQTQALRFTQNKRAMYLTFLPVRTLLGITKVDMWDPGTPITDDPKELLKQGYQRETIRAHFTKVGRYVAKETDALLPTSVLLNARGNLSFDEARGTLTIPEQALPLWIVDGQHRLAGLRYAVDELQQDQVGDFLVPVTIVEDMGKLDEIRHFYIINSTQKRVRTDLADRLLRAIAATDIRVKTHLMRSRRDWKLRAIKICDLLNEWKDSPWEGRIRKPNAPRIGNAVISQVSFCTSLKPVIISDTMSGYSDSELARVLNAFWEAIRSLMPEVFQSPQDFVIQKTPGVYPLHMVAPKVLRKCRDEDNFSDDRIAQIMGADSDRFSDPDFWRSGGDGAALYTGMGAFNQLANEIEERLADQLEPNSRPGGAPGMYHRRK